MGCWRSSFTGSIQWLPTATSFTSVLTDTELGVDASLVSWFCTFCPSRTWGPLLFSCSSLHSSSPRSSAPPPADRAASPAGRTSWAASGRSSWRKCFCGRPRLETAKPRSSWATCSWSYSSGEVQSFCTSFQWVRRTRRGGRCWSAARSRRCPSTWPSTCWGTWCRWPRWRTRSSRSRSTAKSWTRSGSKTGSLSSPVGAIHLYYIILQNSPS